MNKNESIEWLMQNGGPIIRFRTANELIRDIPLEQRKVLLKELLECEEVKKWLSNLESSVHIHSSKDSAAENCIAKLVAYGLTARVPDMKILLDEIFINTFLSNKHRSPHDARILFPFLIAAEFATKPEIIEYIALRIDLLCHFIENSLNDFKDNESVEDLFLSPSVKAREGVPKAWRDKYVWAPSLVGVLPNCYDYYLLSYLTNHEKKRGIILDFVNTARFQRFCSYREFHGSYTWNREKRTCHSSAEMPYLFGYFGFDDAQFCPHKFLLYLDLTSRLPGAASIPWFRNGLEHLEQYRTDTDRYMFPKKYVPERKNGYYLYAGARMRLGEKGREGLEIESTFRMLSMKANAGLLCKNSK